MPKKPKLGTYTGLKQKLLDVSDPYRRFITVDHPSQIPFTYVDLFCGAGGLTKGFFDADYLPVSSVEISDIASETHKYNLIYFSIELSIFCYEHLLILDTLFSFVGNCSFNDNKR